MREMSLSEMKKIADIISRCKQGLGKVTDLKMSVDIAVRPFADKPSVLIHSSVDFPGSTSCSKRGPFAVVDVNGVEFWKEETT